LQAWPRFFRERGNGDVGQNGRRPSIFAESGRVQRVRWVRRLQVASMLGVSCHRLAIGTKCGVGYSGYADPDAPRSLKIPTPRPPPERTLGPARNAGYFVVRRAPNPWEVRPRPRTPIQLRDPTPRPSLMIVQFATGAGNRFPAPVGNLPVVASLRYLRHTPNPTVLLHFHQELERNPALMPAGFLELNEIRFLRNFPNQVPAHQTGKDSLLPWTWSTAHVLHLLQFSQGMAGRSGAWGLNLLMIRPDRFRALLLDLSADDRILSECRIVDGWQYNDIAARLGCHVMCWPTGCTTCGPACDGTRQARQHKPTVARDRAVA
jgi:hypothetical protein